MASSSASSSNKKPTTKKKITLRTSDEHLFDVEESVAMELAIVKAFLEDNSDAEEAITVPLHNVSAVVLTRMICYIKKHLELAASSSPEEEVKAFDDEFANEQSLQMILDLIIAANYLEVNNFLEMLTQVCADRIKNKSVEYVRRHFGIDNDFTPEEEAEIRRETEWAHEGVDKD